MHSFYFNFLFAFYNRLSHNVVKDKPGTIEIIDNRPAAGQLAISKGKSGHLEVVRQTKMLNISAQLMIPS